MDLLQAAAQHRTAAIVTIGISAWISLCLIARLWLLYRKRRFLSKLAWSVVLLVPLFGWLAYAALFTPPSVSSNRAPIEFSRDSMYGGGGHV